MKTNNNNKSNIDKASSVSMGWLWLYVVSVFLFLFVGCCKDDDSAAREPEQRGGEPVPEEPTDNDTIVPLPPATDTAVWGKGSADDPYRVRTAEEWNRLMALHGGDRNAFFRLATDFTLGNPMVCDTFCGHLDGNNMEVRLANRSLFKVLNGGVIENVILNGAVSQLNSDNVMKIETSGGYNLYFGGLVCVSDNNAVIKNCVSKMDYDIQAEYGVTLAPICGLMLSGTVDECSSVGDIAVSSSRQNIIGGIVAEMRGASSKLINCMQVGRIAVDSYGDFAGIVSVVYDGSVVNCCTRAIMNTEHSSSNSGGVVSYCNGGVIDNCYFDGYLSGKLTSLLCYRINNGAQMRYCYAPQTDGLKLCDNNYGIIESCGYFRNGTQLEAVGYYGSNNVIDELNARAATLEGARRWALVEGNVAIVK